MKKMYRCCVRCRIVYGCYVCGRYEWFKYDCSVCEKPCEFYRKKVDIREIPNMSHGLCDRCFLISKKRKEAGYGRLLP